MKQRKLTMLIGGAVLGWVTAFPAWADVNQGDLLRISNYLNGISTMQGDFVQIGPDGDLSEGFSRCVARDVCALNTAPNPTLIIADGFWVAVCDSVAGTFDRFPLSKTPLDLLLRDRVDLRKVGAVQDIRHEGGQFKVTAVDPESPDQGNITMVFADSPLELRQWVIVDDQGLTTTVALSDTRRNVTLKNELFHAGDKCGE